MECIEASRLDRCDLDAWIARGSAVIDGDGAEFVHGAYRAVVGPSDLVAEVLRRRSPETGPLVQHLSCFVYDALGWTRADVDPTSISEHNDTQFDIRVFRQSNETLTPLFAMNLSLVDHVGTWADIDQTTLNPATSMLEIARVPALQPVVLAGAECLLGAAPCGLGVVWEASRLSSAGQIAAIGMPPHRLSDAPFRQLVELGAALATEGRREIMRAQRLGLGLFGLSLAWCFARLPIHLLVGLSQGDIVRRFTEALVGGDKRFYCDLQLDGLHQDARALWVSPGYFAGDVRGFSIDALGGVGTLFDVGRRRTRPARRASAVGFAHAD